jgi:outer membrane protein TolC
MPEPGALPRGRRSRQDRAAGGKWLAGAWTFSLLLLLLFSQARAAGNVLFSPREHSPRVTLAQAITEALQNNRLIQEAEERVGAALADTRSARADFFPKASAAYRYTYLDQKPFMYFDTYDVEPAQLDPADPSSQVGVITGQKTSKAVTAPHDNFHWELSLQQPLFTGFALSALYRMSRLNLNIKELERQLAERDVVRQVKTGYFRILLAKKMLRVAEDTVASLLAHHQDTLSFFEQGLIAWNDVLQAKVALSEARQQQTRAEGNLSMAKAALNTVLGRDVNHAFQVLDQQTSRFHDFRLQTLLETAETNREELRKLDLSLQKVEQNVRLAKSDLYPSLYLESSYEQDGENVQADRNDFRNHQNFRVSLQAEWTLFNWGKRLADISSAQHDFLALQQKLQHLEEQIRLEVKNGLIQLNTARRNIETAERAVRQARENLRITTLQYDQQMATSTEILDAHTFLTRAKSNHYRAVYEYQINLANLERAVGVTDLSAIAQAPCGDTQP